MKKAVVFLAAGVLGSLVLSCQPDDIEQHTQTHSIDVEKHASGDIGLGIDIPHEKK